MKKGLMSSGLLFAGVAFLMLFCWASSAAAQDATWEYEVTIYGWFAGVDGTVHYPGGPGAGQDFSIDADDILSSLEFALMGGFEARRGRWSLLADALYMDVSDSDTTTVTVGPAPGVPVNASAGIDLTTWLLTGAVGYDLARADRGGIALVGGVRYLSADLDANLTLPGVPAGRSESSDLLDGIVGVKGFINLNEKWYIPYYADIGTGDSDFTWQAFAGIGYRFGWGNIRVGYRHLSYDQDDDKLLQDLDLSGPVLGVGFRF
jgi:hypothetical protein